MGTASILICDDEPDLRELMRLSLTPGYSFEEAGDGDEAIELVDRVGPDLVLLDVMMPGTGGLEVLAHMRRSPELRSTPVVVVSAFSEPHDRRAALDAGATRFVKKPFDPEELRSLVEELLSASA